MNPSLWCDVIKNGFSISLEAIVFFFLEIRNKYDHVPTTNKAVFPRNACPSKLSFSNAALFLMCHFAQYLRKTISFKPSVNCSLSLD